MFLFGISTKMDSKFDAFARRYVVDFALEYGVKLTEDGIKKAVELFSVCAHEWQTDPSVSINSMALKLGFEAADEPIVELVRAAWTKIYTE